MPYVSVPKDLTKVKTKLAFNLTKRQLISFGLAALVGLPVYLLTHKIIGNNLAVLLLMLTTIPFFFIGMYEKDGQPFEKVARNYIRTRFLWPKIRPYKTNNLYSYLSSKGENPYKNKAASNAGKKAATGAKKSKRSQAGLPRRKGRSA